MKSKDFEIRTPFLGVGDPLVAFAMEPERPVKATVSYEMVTKD